MTIPDAPWIRETERTGFCRTGWFNHPPHEDTVICDRCREPVWSGDWFSIDGEVLCADCYDTIIKEVRDQHGF